jgi:chemotaxis protein MotA
MQLTAGIIVLAGTLGAVLVSHSIKNLKEALRLARGAFFENENKVQAAIINEIVTATKICKKDSLMALEQRVSRIDDPFLKKIMRTLVDGIDPTLIREIFETEIETEEEQLLAAAKVWADAGGFAPTIGIIGAVLGLIHVMGNLSDTSKLGAGIAVAFVAAIYGVVFANILFIPIGNKIKGQIEEHIRLRRMTHEGALLISSGLSPAVVDQKVRAFNETALSIL